MALLTVRGRGRGSKADGEKSGDRSGSLGLPRLPTLRLNAELQAPSQAVPLWRFWLSDQYPSSTSSCPPRPMWVSLCHPIGGYLGCLSQVFVLTNNAEMRISAPHPWAPVRGHVEGRAWAPTAPFTQTPRFPHTSAPHFPLPHGDQA